MINNKSIFHRQISRRYCLLVLTLFVGAGFASAEAKRSASRKPVVYNNITRGYLPVDRAAEKVYGQEFRIMLVKEKEGFVSAQSKDGARSLFGYPFSRLEKAAHGPVLCLYIVTADGRPTEPRILQAPNQRVSDMVIREILSQRFTPARLRGAAVASLHSEEFTIGKQNRQQVSNGQGLENPLGINGR